MMTRQERAKQFMPFDAMKGLQEALRDREERHSRVERHDISDEQREQNSRVFQQLDKGTKVRLNYYCSFHDIERDAVVTEVSIPFRYLRLGAEKVLFENIYSIVIVDTIKPGRERYV